MGLGQSRRAPWEHSHRRIKSEENTIDPDDGKSWLCSACTLPIFSTPFKISYQKSKENVNVHHKLLLHDQCASLPEKLKDHPLHPREALHLVQNKDSSSSTVSCEKCREKCGTMFYKCIDSSCDLRLDLLCSLQIKILHRSHEHRLMVIRGSASFICGVCGTQHQGLSAPSYFCSACNFWIHRDCASLPNAIKLLHPKHQHSLFLTYGYDGSSSSSATEGNASDQASSSKCAICGDVLQSLGVYLCVKCGYYVHIRCATSDPQSFQPVLIRDAKLAELLHLPMADERANIVQYMLENIRAGDDKAEAEQQEEKEDDDEGCRHDPKLQKHSLIFHDEDDEDEDEDDDDDDTGHSSRVCNACVQFISPPFYSCSKCRDFLLHRCCADLPRKIQHVIHPEHTFLLFTETPESSLDDPGFTCLSCVRQCSGYGYSCKTCDITLDVVCALMPPSITHKSHGKTHILHFSPRFDYLQSKGKCSCCRLDLLSIFYECSNCRHLKLHARCALLPTTVNHKFDQHPLKLTTSPKISLITTTTNDDGDDEAKEEDSVYYIGGHSSDDDSDAEYSEEDMQHFCAVCETGIKKRSWYYSCKQCDQSFHIDCIPFLDRLSKVKFGVSVHGNFHDCPLTLVSMDTLSGYHCDVCKTKFEHANSSDDEGDQFGYECTKCNYRVHGYCTNK